jgi:predicted aconitase with swiveling domain
MRTCSPVKRGVSRQVLTAPLAPDHNTILVVGTAKGGVTSTWMIYEMKMRSLCPLAIVFNTVYPMLAQGTAHGGIAMLAGFEVDITKDIPCGSTLRINPSMKTLELIPISLKYNFNSPFSIL